MTTFRLLALLFALLTATGARADDDHERARAALREGRILPLDTIVAQASREFPGEILDVEFEDEDGRLIYEIKLITADGRVLELEYDAATGALLKTRGHRRNRHGG